MQPITTPNTANKSRETFKKNRRLEAKRKQMLFRHFIEIQNFFANVMLMAMGCLILLFFPAKKLRKIRVPILRMGLFFFFLI